MKYILREHYGMKAIFRDDETFIMTFSEDWVYDAFKSWIAKIPGASVYNSMTEQYDVGNLDEMLAGRFEKIETSGVRVFPGDYGT